MSQDQPAAEKAPTATPSEVSHKRPEKVVLRPYPKVVFLYPTWIMSIVAGIVTSLWLENDSTALGMWFIVVFGLNLVVISFDFPRTTSFTLLFLIVAVIFGSLWINHRWPFLQALADFWGSLKPAANGWFYWLFAIAISIIYVFVFFDTRFDYWEIMPNEIIHHHGVLGDVKRYPAPQLKMEKEITDVFEWILMRSGRLLLHPSTERHAIVLDNIPNINRREREIQSLLGVLDVHVHTSAESGEES